MSTKQKLKNAKDLIDSKNFNESKNLIENILLFEPLNYNALVFNGLIHLNLKDYQASESSYRKAIEANPTNALAWRGLASFYQSTNNLDRYTKVLFELCELFFEQSDATKLAETLQKLISHYKSANDKAKLSEYLHYYLPNSRYYSLLSTLPPPDHSQPLLTTTYESQIAIHENLPLLIELKDIQQYQLSNYRSSEFTKRKTRLGAPSPTVIQNQLIKETSLNSPLVEIYNEIINHPLTSDDLRRDIESQLLKFKYDHLLSVSANEQPLKSDLLSQVMTMASGIVNINIKNDLAWCLIIEWFNVEYLNNYIPILLKQFQLLFPQHKLHSIIDGFFTYLPYMKLPDDDHLNQVSSDSILNNVIENFDNSSLFSHRVLSYIYLQEKLYDDAAEVSQAGIELCKLMEKQSSLKFDLHILAFEEILSISLTYNYPPKYHLRALGHIYNVLNSRPKNVELLICHAFCLQHSDKWSQARKIYNEARTIDNNNLLAYEEESWCFVMEGDYNNGREGLENVINLLDKSDEFEDKQLQQARVNYKLGRCYWEQGGDERVKSFSLFIKSIKFYNSFAPAFTSLGLYYLNVANPPDVVRASKCFQKAFELDSRETEAARWLADGFADEKEWDLVEIVSRRTIEGEGSGTEELAKGRYLSKNSWAWKAIGVVELNRYNFAAAIEAFQIALRANPKDISSWLRLGESYSNAGRHAAALRTFHKSRELDDKNWLSLYFITDVLRLMGLYQPAINTIESIYDENNMSILILLIQCYNDLANYEFKSGFIDRSTLSYLNSLKYSLIVLKKDKYFRIVWKLIGDAFFGFSNLLSIDNDSLQDDFKNYAKYILHICKEENILNKMHSKELININNIFENIDILENDYKRNCLLLTIISYEFSISLDFGKPDYVASSWFDLSSSLFSFTKLSTLNSQLKEKEISRNLSVNSIKNALKSEPGNDEYWNLLGNIVFESNQKLCQHCYIKAIEIDSRNASYWSNLGFFYLNNLDYEIANDAFKRSQTIDPDYILAWIGMSIVVNDLGKHDEARLLYNHSFSISGGSELESNFGFAFNEFKNSKFDTALHSPSYAMQRYTECKDDDPAALHLSAIIGERLNQLDIANEKIKKCLQLLEMHYEDEENEEIEKYYTIANITSGRINLLNKNYEISTECFNTSLTLTNDEKLKIQSLIGIGLCQFNSNNKQDSILTLKNGFEEFKNVNIGVILSQVYYSLNDTENSINTLLECVEIDNENLEVISTLTAIGILINDESLLDAALTEILSMAIDKRNQIDPKRNVNDLLLMNSIINDDKLNTLKILSKNLYFEPYNLDIRRTLSLNLFSINDSQLASSMAIGGNDNSETKLNADYCSLLSIANLENNNEHDLKSALSYSQRAIILEPWNQKYWETLSLVYLSSIQN